MAAVPDSGGGQRNGQPNPGGMNGSGIAGAGGGENGETADPGVSDAVSSSSTPPSTNVPAAAKKPAVSTGHKSNKKQMAASEVRLQHCMR